MYCSLFWVLLLLKYILLLQSPFIFLFSPSPSPSPSLYIYPLQPFASLPIFILFSSFFPRFETWVLFFIISSSRFHQFSCLFSRTISFRKDTNSYFLISPIWVSSKTPKSFNGDEWVFWERRGLSSAVGFDPQTPPMAFRRRCRRKNAKLRRQEAWAEAWPAWRCRLVPQRKKWLSSLFWPFSHFFKIFSLWESVAVVCKFPWKASTQQIFSVLF